VTDDWAAVADAINQRVTKLDMNQRELIKRSGVSKQIVGEVQNDTIRRRRSPRTLKALSIALNWHPDHLSAVLAGRTPPQMGEPVPWSDDDVPGHLSVIEEYLRQMLDRIDTIDGRLGKIEDSIETTNHRTDSDSEC
jgi:hypothetical protein